MGCSDGWAQMTVLAEALRLALLAKDNQVQPYRLIEDRPFDVMHDLNHPSICPVRTGCLDLSGKLDGGSFTVLCETIQPVDEIRAYGHPGQCDTGSDDPSSDN
jgi:hypothetical protein